MKSLIIGGAGFVGHYLIKHLTHLGRQVHATHLPAEKIVLCHCDAQPCHCGFEPGSVSKCSQSSSISFHVLDILDHSACKQLLSHIQPDEIYHLAAQSSAAVSWKMPALTVDVNIKGTINILESVRELTYKPRILLVGSGEEYGVVSPGDLPIKEDLAPNPANVYAVTKATQTMLGKLYVTAYGLDIVMTRSFNHIGPGQSDTFAVSSFCKQIAEIEKGLCSPVLKVGNLSVERDFTDVRDVVKAYSLLLEKGIIGEVYNVGSGIAISLQSITDELLSLVSIEIAIEVDATRIRPINASIIVADTTRIKQTIDWKPIYAIKNTLINMVDYWKMSVK